MKFITIILSLYIFALSATPCADIERNGLAHDSIDHSAEKDRHTHDKNGDFCSPFCICNCCGQTILAYAPTLTFDFQMSFNAIKKPTPGYTFVWHSDFFGSIWQPPQLV